MKRFFPVLRFVLEPLELPLKGSISCLVVVVGGIQSGSWKLHAFNVFMFVFVFVFSVHFHKPLPPFTSTLLLNLPSPSL